MDYKEIWLEKQVTLVVTNEATLSYRVIDKAEMEFIGTTKSPYDFFKSAFSGAADDIERSFIEV